MAGVALTDRKLGAEVRSLTLKKIKVVLDDEYQDKEFQKAVILKLASTVLPRINEHSGEDGDAIKVAIEVAKEVAVKNELYGAAHDTSGDSPGQASV